MEEVYWSKEESKHNDEVLSWQKVSYWKMDKVLRVLAQRCQYIEHHCTVSLKFININGYT